MKRLDSKGFTIIEGLTILAVITLVGVIGWFIYSNNSSVAPTQTTQNKSTTQNIELESDIKTTDGLNYVIPAGWKNTINEFEPIEYGNGKYLLSPDYKEGGTGQLSIVNGASISFDKYQSSVINSNTSIDKALSILKSTDDAEYFDRDSIQKTIINGLEVIMYNSGHTTDGVTVLFKTASQKTNTWIETSFSTSTGNDGIYNAKENQYYSTYTVWLNKFIELNK